MKRFTLKFIQIAWPCQAIAVVIFSMFATVFLSAGRIALWHQLLPLVTGLITAQAACAGGGPLLSDVIKGKKEKEE